ncbi:MAG TPA: hypothetical protein VH684_21680 [Xanthobacteraceae bacterium]|jgi:hypothetical protein
MRSFLASRNRRADDRIPVPAEELRGDHISILGFATGVTIALLAFCASGDAQVNGMPNSPGPGAHRAVTAAPAQRAQVVGTAQRPKIRITAQRIEARAPAQHAQSSPAAQHERANAARQHAQSAASERAHSAASERAQSKPVSAPTVGSHTAAKPAKEAQPKTAAAAAATAKAAMPVPAAELLAPPSQPNCAFDSTRTDADDRQKLDYERQCYRHAEMIIRDRLERLQGDVEQMIKAAKSTERVSANR